MSNERLQASSSPLLLLVDGSNLLFQMFYGMPARITNAEGKPIQGTLGFVGALLKIIRMTQPTHVAVIFDGEHENERTLLDTDYKANRPDYSQLPEEETPFSQLPDIYHALDFLQISHMETSDCETDDILAGYALTYGKEMDIIISSFDSDFFQLITDTVKVLRYRGEKTILCTPEWIQEKFNITPAQYADFKSLVGDTADNIKGADKIGPKTAAALLHTYGSLDALLAGADFIDKPSVKASVLQHADRLKTNYKLIKLTADTTLPFSIEELKFTYNGTTTTEVLKGIGLK